MIALFIVLGILLLLCALYLVLIAPGRRANLDGFCRPYAHRGLWQAANGIPENSLAAFDAACRRGYAMELDVQLAKDGVVMVFHDYTLKRMCGAEGKLVDKTAAELAALRLADTDEKIPTFAEVLALVDGRAPLLVELKGETANDALCEAVAALLDNYHGAYVIESFNPLLLAWFAKHRPQVVRGLLADDMFAKKKQRTFARRLRDMVIQWRLLNVSARPQFLAWNLHAKHTLTDRILLALFRIPSFCWTARTAAEFDAATADGAVPIFDSIPDKW